MNGNHLHQMEARSGKLEEVVAMVDMVVILVEKVASAEEEKITEDIKKTYKIKNYG